ncbi:TetR family transcriptional regulator [Rhodococcus opacus]|uniref:TetR family transcriptional regulator n=1 Tax=Rhodococcus opacus TaxID=37919 RepID=A0A1B1K4Y4_RHOOP|nr:MULTISPECIES: TetR/AcrR family transcriptional regulator [Rhodococcus]ANS27608.1 TetR family transcriptional regulator [Rhodococcus opacus]QDQ92120.1 TetR/AcrR family transcriptional regulator [Rhodococcus sp. WB9]
MASPVKQTRMSATERRELVLAAASRAFARDGYHGTSTDAVAREAGVSQPYVVRMFGSKSRLFADVFDRAMRRIMDTFEPHFDDVAADPENDESWLPMGIAYTELLEDRDLLLVMMHGFTSGANPEIGALARDWMSRLYTQIRTRTGCSPEQARTFIANGMLLNTLLAMQVPEHAGQDPALEELAVCAFGNALDAAGSENASEIGDFRS